MLIKHCGVVNIYLDIDPLEIEQLLQRFGDQPENLQLRCPSLSPPPPFRVRYPVIGVTGICVL